jgi:hypothetical protein
MDVEAVMTQFGVLSWNMLEGQRKTMTEPWWAELNLQSPEHKA